MTKEAAGERKKGPQGRDKRGRRGEKKEPQGREKEAAGERKKEPQRRDKRGQGQSLLPVDEKGTG